MSGNIVDKNITNNLTNSYSVNFRLTKESLTNEAYIELPSLGFVVGVGTLGHAASLGFVIQQVASKNWFACVTLSLPYYCSITLVKLLYAQ